jgi:hypothetical protein
MALSAIAIPPKVGLVTELAPARNPDEIKYPNKDCIITRFPGTANSGACPEPESCHRAGALCFIPDRPYDRTENCRQGILDPTKHSGYRIQYWKSGSSSTAIRRNCAGCQCRSRKPPPTPPQRKAETKLKDKLETPQASRSVRSKYSIEAAEITYKQIQIGDSMSSVDEESTPNLPKPAGSDRFKDKESAPNPAMAVGSSSRGETQSSSRDTASSDPSSSPVDEGRTSNKAITQEPEHPATPGGDSYPPLLYNPTHYNPDFYPVSLGRGGGPTGRGIKIVQKRHEPDCKKSGNCRSRTTKTPTSRRPLPDTQ